MALIKNYSPLKGITSHYSASSIRFLRPFKGMHQFIKDRHPSTGTFNDCVLDLRRRPHWSCPAHSCLHRHHCMSLLCTANTATANVALLASYRCHTLQLQHATPQPWPCRSLPPNPAAAMAIPCTSATEPQPGSVNSHKKIKI